MGADSEFLLAAEATAREVQAELLACKEELHAERESAGALEVDNDKLKRRNDKLVRQMEAEASKKDYAQLMAEMVTMEGDYSVALKKITKERDGLTKALADKEHVMGAANEKNAALAVEANELHGQLTEMSGAFESVQADCKVLEAASKADKEALEQARGELESATSTALRSKTKISLLEKELGEIKEKLEATTTEAALSKEQLESRRNKFALVAGAFSSPSETKNSGGGGGDGGGRSTSGLSDNWKKALSPMMKKKQNIAFLLNVLKSPKGMAKLRAASAAGDAASRDPVNGCSGGNMAAESKHGGGTYDSLSSCDPSPSPSPSRKPSLLESFADRAADDALGALPPTPPPQTRARRVSSRASFSTPTTTITPTSAAMPPTSAASAATSTGATIMNPFSIDEDTPALSPASTSDTASAGAGASASMSSAPRPKEEEGKKKNKKKKEAGEYLKQMLHRRRASAAQMDLGTGGMI
jgi:hypothetical protein